MSNTENQRHSRKPRDQKDSAPIKHNKEDLKAILREKLKEKQLGRLAPSARDNKIEKLKNKLQSAKGDKEKKEYRNKLKSQIELLERVNENQIDSFSGEYPSYADNTS